MIHLKATLQKFGNKGEKTGWTYIPVPKNFAEQLKPGNKKSFRVKGKIDDHSFEAMAMIPMGEGNFILPVNAVIRKAIKKIHGATVEVFLVEDKAPLKLSEDLNECFMDEPDGLKYFNTLPQSHRNWYSNWIKTAKTDSTRAKRIATVIKACACKISFAEMMRQYRDERKLLS